MAQNGKRNKQSRIGLIRSTRGSRGQMQCMVSGQASVTPAEAGLGVTVMGTCAFSFFPDHKDGAWTDP